MLSLFKSAKKPESNAKKQPAKKPVGKAKTGKPSTKEQDKKARANEIEAKTKKVSKEDIQKLLDSASGTSARETVIVELVDFVMIFAYLSRASDVHFEPMKDEVAVIRLRVDGILHDAFESTIKIHDRVISRLKVMTDMRSDQHRSPQDGRFTFDTGGELVDVRTSIMPVVYGEKSVLRLLSGGSHKLTLKDLGFAEGDLKRMEKEIAKPWGMILTTGPTGSGKTTSIYSILQQINKRDVNIATVEDPVEYKMKGINQSQVDRAADFTFANGLRSLLRQDPDIIMVGEIRDQETAKIAVNAALTGHKLLSTLHTNDAATTIPRLIDMGVEPYLIASTLNVAVAQRLMRKVCEDCKKTITIKKAEHTNLLDAETLKLLFGSKTTAKIAKAEGCTKCGDTGYKGRIGIFEVLTNSPAIQALILTRATGEDLRKQAMEEGMVTLQADGVSKLKSGLSTIEEFTRVLSS